MEPEGDFHAKPVFILDMREVVLRKQPIVHVKVKWDHYAPSEATSKREDVMKKVYSIVIQSLNDIEYSLRTVTRI